MYTPPTVPETADNESAEQRLQDPLLAGQDLKSDEQDAQSPAQPQHPLVASAPGPTTTVQVMETPNEGIPSHPAAQSLAWVPGVEVLQSNVELPDHLPDGMTQWGALGPKMLGWLFASVTSLLVSLIFGLFLLFGFLSLPASILGIVASSLYLCRCCDNVSRTAAAIRVLGWVAFGLDLAAFLLAVFILSLIYRDCARHHAECSHTQYNSATGIVAAVVVLIHLSVGQMVVRSIQAVKRQLNPVSSGLVSL